MTRPWYQIKGLTIRNTFVKCESSITYNSKVIANFFFAERNTQGKNYMLPPIYRYGSKKNMCLLDCMVNQLLECSIELCFTPLLILFDSYHGECSHYTGLSLISAVLGCGSKVSCRRTHPRKKIIGMH